MRICLLRAGLSRADGLSDLVLGNPRAWLGTAYHEVLEKVPEIDRQGDVDRDLDRLWTDAIARQYERVKSHPLDRRFGSPETWPGYHLTEASVRLRAHEVASLGSTGRTERAPRSARERPLVACGGKLVGRPDVVRDGEVVDYKTGEVLESDGDVEIAAVQAAYVRQLRLYGVLVREDLGWWPRRGWLLPAGGPAVEIALNPEDCEREAAEAVALLDKYNKRIENAADPRTLALASPEACRWCQYKSFCPAFWEKADSTWSGRLDGAAVEGILLEPPRGIHGSKAFAISLDVQFGSEGCNRIDLAPLSPSVHGSIAGVSPGTRVRIIGLRLRADGSLVPGQRTVITCVGEVPTLSVSKANT